MANTWVLSALWVGLACSQLCLPSGFASDGSFRDYRRHRRATRSSAPFSRPPADCSAAPSGSPTSPELAPSYCSNHCGQYILSAAAPASEERPTWEPSTQAAEPETV